MPIPPLGIDGSALATVVADLWVITAAGIRVSPKLGRIQLEGGMRAVTVADLREVVRA